MQEFEDRGVWKPIDQAVSKLVYEDFEGVVNGINARFPESLIANRGTEFVEIIYDMGNIGLFCNALTLDENFRPNLNIANLTRN